MLCVFKSCFAFGHYFLNTSAGNKQTGVTPKNLMYISHILANATYISHILANVIYVTKCDVRQSHLPHCDIHTQLDICPSHLSISRCDTHQSNVTPISHTKTTPKI